MDVQDKAGPTGAVAAAETPDAADATASTAPADSADSADSSAPPGPSGSADRPAAADPSLPKRLTRAPLVLAALALLLVAAMGAGWSGWSWWQAAHDDSLRFSQTRDEVLQAGEQAIQNLNTLDYRTVDQGIRIWQQSTTGSLHDQLTQGSADFAAKVRQAKTSTTAKILDGAVVDLNERTGKASVIVAVEITVTDPSGQPSAKRERLQGQLVRTNSGWKLSAVGQVPVAGATN